jgi:hypothetical protein
VEVLTIVGPPLDKMKQLLSENKAILPTAMEAKDWSDTTSIQNQWKAGVKVWYVIDSSRKVVYVGSYNPAKIRAAVGTLGAKWERKGKY